MSCASAFPRIGNHVAVQEIERVGGTVRTKHSGPGWMRQWLGDGWIVLADATTEVDIFKTKFTDAELPCVENLIGVETLRLDGTDITDSGLDCLAGLSRLKHLSLGNTAVTDDGLVKLNRLNNLEHLNLGETCVTNEGLKNLALGGLNRLKFLNLSGTGVTNDGLKHLEKMSSLKGLAVFATAVTTAGQLALNRRIHGLRVGDGPYPPCPRPRHFPS